MLPMKRKEEIKQLLLTERTVSVSEIARRFSVSDETARRDLAELDAEGFCIKTYGGASLSARNLVNTPQRVKSSLFVGEKRYMAAIAVRLIHPGDCIFLDFSNTAAALCPLIQDMQLTVVTNSHYVFSALAEAQGITLLSTGGIYDAGQNAVFGDAATTFLQNHYIDKAFLSCRSAHADKGFFDCKEQHAALRRAAMEASGAVYVMADHTKLSGASFTKICSLQETDVLITDKPLSNQWTDACRKHAVTVLNDQLQA